MIQEVELDATGQRAETKKMKQTEQDTMETETGR